MRLINPISLALALLSFLPAARADLQLTAGPRQVDIANDFQKVSFVRDEAGRFLLSSYVRAGNQWQGLFDGQLPIIQGTSFDLHPTAYEVKESTARRVAVRFTGQHENPRYSWELLVEAQAGSSLIRFRVACRLPQRLILAGLEPQMAFWMNRARADVVVSQGPGNIYHGRDDKQWGNSFPAAYLWSQGLEAAVFFDMSPMTWMNVRNIFRFHDVRAAAFSQGGKTALGLQVVKRNFHEVESGEMVFECYLHAAARADRPTRLDALDMLIRTFAPLHPSTAPLPVSRLSPRQPTWAAFARGTIDNLMLRDVTWADVPVPGGKGWRDQPPFDDVRLETLPVSSDYAVESGIDPATNRKSVQELWDFSCCHNYLAPWIAINRLHPDPRQSQFLKAKVDGLPAFFNPRTGLFTYKPCTLYGREMSWQNLTFSLEAAKIHRVQGREEFNPAVGGKFLLSADGLIQLAHNTGYILPQFFDPVRKVAAGQADVPELGVVYEPWQLGTYAYLMCQAYEMTGRTRYLDEAAAAVGKLFGGMTVTVANQRYTATYSDPVDFPIAEIFGNAWGVAACCKLHQITGQADGKKYLRWADDFRNVLLRMTYWYESALREDPKDRFLHNAGLFRNQGGDFSGSPWENIEAVLPLTVSLKTDRPPFDLLLRLFNLQRINGFYFYPPVFDETVSPGKKLQDHAAAYLPIENFYTHEKGGTHGGMGRAIYMSSPALWNYLLYEAMGQCDDPEVMALNLDVVDGFEESLASAQRHFILYNPTRTARQVTMKFKALAGGEYRLSVQDCRGATRESVHPASALAEGIAVSLGPMEFARLGLRHREADELAASVRAGRLARDRLAHAYHLLQASAAGGEAPADLLRLKETYLSALEDYRQGRFAPATRQAEEVTSRLRTK